MKHVYVRVCIYTFFRERGILEKEVVTAPERKLVTCESRSYWKLFVYRVWNNGTCSMDMNVCMYACMHACLQVCMCVRMYVYVRVYVCVHVCMYAWRHGCMYVQ